MCEVSLQRFIIVLPSPVAPARPGREKTKLIMAVLETEFHRPVRELLDFERKENYDIL